MGAHNHLRRTMSEPEDENENNPIGTYDGHLILKSLITHRGSHSQVDKDGYLTVMGPDSFYTSFSLDVGFNRGQTSAAWHSIQPHLYSIGIEANANLVYHFEHSQDLNSIRDNTMVVHAAASSRDGGVIRFNPGFGWNNVSDTGSVFGFTDPKREKVRLQHANSHIAVRNLRLSDLLRHVPLPRNTSFLWDTMKLDVQGADVDAMMSSSEYVEHFICVVGEFDTTHYAVKGVKTDPKPFLTEHKFVMVYDIWPGNSIWLNSRLFSLYKDNPQRFGCHNVYDSRVDPGILIANYEKGGI